MCTTQSLPLDDIDDMTKIYMNYNHSEGFDHWMNYGKHYDDHLRRFKDYDKVNLLEIGVQSGGSTRVWHDYFGSRLQYIGIDINPKCIRFANSSLDIKVEIGSQLDQKFLRDICNKYGPFDIVIDDGGHTAKMMMASFNVLWLCMKDKGIYVIEDLHTMNIPGFSESVNGKDTYDFLANLGRHASSHFTKNGITSPDEVKNGHALSKHIAAVTFYDSMVFISYQEKRPPLQRFRKGDIWIPYK